MANLSNINNKFLVTTGGNVLINKTAANNSTVGTQIMSTGDVNATVSGDTVARFNRLGTDGEIIRFQHDTATDGAINSLSGRIAIGSSNTGIFFDSIRQVITPWDITDNDNEFNNISLGRDIVRFKDLYLSGIVDAGSTIYTAESLRFDGTGLNATDKKLYSPADGELQWFTHDLAGAHAFSVSHQGTRRVYLNTSGDSYFTGGEVGIGTASPTNMLSIQGSSGSSKGLEIFHSNGNKVAELIHNGSGDEGMLRLLDSNSETVRIAGETNVDSYINSGNVGIGTTTPSAKLEVNGDILVTGDYKTVYNDTSVAQQWYKFYEKSGYAGGDYLHFALLTKNNAEFMAEVRIFVPTYAGFSSGYGSLSNGQGAQVEIRMGGLNSQTNILEAIDEVANLGSTSTLLQLYLRIDPAFSNTEVEVINYADATVHFSMSGTWTTTDPRSGLSTRSFPFYNGNTALNNTLNITSDNEVGIGVGTQNPTTALEVRNDDGLGNGLHLIADINRAGGTDAQLILGYFADGTNATGPVVYAANGFPLLFSTGSVERMRLNPSNQTMTLTANTATGTNYIQFNNNAGTAQGYVGFGSSGNNDLYIVQQSSSSNIQFQNNGSTRMTIASNGRVGINTTNPLELLNVHQTTATAGLYMPISIAGSRYQADYAVGIAFRPENNSSAYAAKTAIVGSGGGYGYNQADLHFCLNQSATITDEVTLSDSRMTIKKSGDVGIGTTSPANKLTVNGDIGYVGVIGQGSIYGNTGNSSYANMQLYNPATGYSTFNNQSYGYYFNTGGGTKLTILNNGYVGIGDTSPAKPLVVYSAAPPGGVTIKVQSGNASSWIQNVSTGSSWQIGSTTAGWQLYNDNTSGYRVTVTNAGNVGIGLTNPDAKLEVTTSTSQYTGRFDYTGSSGGAYGCLKLRISANTSPSFIDLFYDGYSTNPLTPVGAIVTTGSAVLYSSFSDYRLKENIANLTGALDRVNSLQPKTFNYINRPEATNEGFLAHELQEIVPQAVSGTKDGVDEDGNPKYQGVDNAHLVPLLVGAIKELKAEIELLKNK